MNLQEMLQCNERLGNYQKRPAHIVPLDKDTVDQIVLDIDSQESQQKSIDLLTSTVSTEAILNLGKYLPSKVFVDVQAIFDSINTTIYLTGEDIQTLQAVDEETFNEDVVEVFEDKNFKKRDVELLMRLSAGLHSISNLAWSVIRTMSDIADGEVSEISDLDHAIVSATEFTADEASAHYSGLAGGGTDIDFEYFKNTWLNHVCDCSNQQDDDKMYAVRHYKDFISSCGNVVQLALRIEDMDVDASVDLKLKAACNILNSVANGLAYKYFARVHYLNNITSEILRSLD